MVALYALVGCTNSWSPGGPPTCEQVCMHRHLQFSRATGLGEPRQGSGRACVCVPAVFDGSRWLTFQALRDGPAASLAGPIVIANPDEAER